MSFARVTIRRSLAVRSIPQRVAVFSRRPMSSSSHGYQPKSDLPWAIGSAIGTVVGLAWVYGRSSSSADHHAETHDTKHPAANHAEKSAPAALKSEGGGEAENGSHQNEKDSADQELGTEAPKPAVDSEDLESPSESKGESTEDGSSTDDLVDSIKQALDTDAPATAEPVEEASSSGSDGFVKVEKEDASPAQEDTNVTPPKKPTKKATSSATK